MKKMLSLIKTSMSDNMELFKINKKSQTKSKKFLPFFLGIMFLGYASMYANMIIEPLIGVNLEYVMLSLFAIITSFLTLAEGIYKSGNLMFNCKDDNLMFSLPIKKSTILFIRIFKFYIFELIYNSLFLVPAMVVYASYVKVSFSYYVVSIIMVFLLPIIPIVISCIAGGIISAFSSEFRFKNFIQIITTTVILLAVFYLSFSLQGIMENFVENAASINDIITKLYYPVGAYIKLITNFQLMDLLVFIAINILLFAIMVVMLSKTYFKINSNIKSVKIKKQNPNFRIKTSRPIISLIRKELNRFISSPVFVINAGFGLVLFVIVCVGVCVKFDGIIESLSTQEAITRNMNIEQFIPAILFGLICFASLMSSITSSMISLEGKTFSILKTLPINPFTAVFSKVLTAIIIMIPFILIGDIIFFIRFRFDFLEILLILISSFVLPIVSETIGIIVNLKYPKMDAENDTEIVKQSISSMIAVLTGIIAVGITLFALVICFLNNISVLTILTGGVIIYLIICIILLMCLKKNAVKDFNAINI